MVEFNRFDVSAKELVWDGPAAVLERLDVPLPGPVDVIDSDITALTAAADKVIMVGGPEPFLVNVEFQSSHETDLIGYRIMRLWKEDPESYLTGGVNLVPLAPLANVPGKALPGVVQRIAERINAEPEPRASMLLTATYLLMGRRHSEEMASQLLEGVRNMRESSTYQAILREGVNTGRLSEAQRLLVLLGEDRFGVPNNATRIAIEEFRDFERLERMSRRTHDAKIRDWDGLLETS